MLNIEMLQNFRIRDSSLDGNTLRFALYVAVLFMVDTACAGLRLISPINTELADYYINNHHFVDLTGGGSNRYFIETLRRFSCGSKKVFRRRPHN